MEADLASQFAKFGAALPEQFRDRFELWPELLPMVQLFCRVITQWVSVPYAGITALNYPAVYPIMDRLFPDPHDWLQAQADLQIMEAAALAFFQEERE